MIDLSDLGLAPVTSAATETAATVATNTDAAFGLIPGSMKARLLYSAFSRQPVTVVDSPPGAGKTTLIVEVLDVLLKRSDYKIVVATPTKRGGLDLAQRLAEELGDDEKAPAVVVNISGLVTVPEGCHKSVPANRRQVVVRTISSCEFSPPECDILILDEAYQATYAAVAAAADGADQVIMVGDPGQIGPVITQDTTAWNGKRNAPHLRGPEVFARREDATVLQMDATYRLGQETVDAIAPLYGFPFESRRPDRHLTNRAGDRLPEIATLTLDEQDMDAAGIHSIPTLKRIADAAIQMVGSTVHSTDAEGNPTTHRLTEKDVAVVVGHNVQANAISAILRSEARDGVYVGTADKMQGGQWHAVIAVDPLTGHDTVSPFQLDKGRLCVMASRHLTHMTWVTDGRSVEKLDAAAEESPDALTGIAVRRHLTANPVEFPRAIA